MVLLAVHRSTEPKACRVTKEGHRARYCDAGCWRYCCHPEERSNEGSVVAFQVSDLSIGANRLATVR
jgi:hypothetical protein